MSNLRISLRVGLLILGKYLTRHLWEILGVILVLLAAIFLELKLDFLSVNPNTVRIGFIGTYQEYDLPIEATRLLSTGLTKADQNGRTVANLASGWETNNDSSDFKFKLKDNLKWSDGSPIKSSDLEFSIPNTEVIYPDSQTIEFKLKEAYSPLPSLLTKPIFKKGTLLGVGPYKVLRLEKSRIFITKIVLEPLQPGLPKVTVRFYPNEKTALAGFSLGEVEVLAGVSTKQTPGGVIFGLKEQTDYSKEVSVFYNTKDPLLSNRSLRQALSFISPEINGQIKAVGPYPISSWSYNPDSKQYLNKPDEAKDALGRAKNSGSEESLKKEITLTTTPSLEEVGGQVVNSWKSLGLNAVLRVESGRPQNFQALLITQGIPSDPDQYFLWHATQGNTNLAKYDSKRADKDLEDGRKAVKEEERKQSYFNFQKVLLEDAPATFLYFPKYNVVYLKKAEGRLNKIMPIILPE